ncbi:hypothetical protein ACP4OV_001637 [Aristida adscensionis]
MAMAAAVAVAAAVLTAAWVAAAAAAGGLDDGVEVERGMAFEEGFLPLFGEGNMEVSPDGRSVRLTLDRRSGAGFISSDYYHHGFFSAAVRLPADHTAGVVVAFYLSNGDVFEKEHDELDLEFLGNRRRHEWRLQTNVYGNGSTGRGREERYLMPFDPTAAAHRFSILWSPAAVVFSVDGVPIREVPRAPAMAGDFPSKPMAVYATIWDGSTWATDNGRYKVNYKRGPFTAEFSGLVLRGCPAGAVAGGDMMRLRLGSGAARERCAAAEAAEEEAAMTARRRMAMRRWRGRQMVYTVCYDTNRYPRALPECDVNAGERQKFWEWGESKVVRPRVRGARSRRRTPPPALVSLQQAD